MTGDLTPEQRSMRARMGAHALWAKVEDPRAQTAPAGNAAMDRFEREVDPEGKLSAKERARRVEHVKKAYVGDEVCGGSEEPKRLVNKGSVSSG